MRIEIDGVVGEESRLARRLKTLHIHIAGRPIRGLAGMCGDE
jgi:hypothetical protein